jgi:opacity protein-like surface antigen
MRSRSLTVARAFLVIAMLGCAAAPASADWLFTPYLGINFGHSADFGDVGDFEDNFEKKAVFGGSLAWMGAGIIGVEADLGWSPNFFEFTTGDVDFDFGDSNLTTLMGNLIVGVPIGGSTGGGIRPYGVGGIGLMRSSIGAGDLFDDVSSNDFGFNLGGGVHGFFNDTVGLRGDIRYFRSLRGDDDDDDDDDFDLDLSDFHFWRATIGVTIRFGN